MNATEQRTLRRQARAEGKAVYYRNRANDYHAQATACRYRGADAAAAQLDRKAQADEATASRLQG